MRCRAQGGRAVVTGSCSARIDDSDRRALPRPARLRQPAVKGVRQQQPHDWESGRSGGNARDRER